MKFPRFNGRAAAVFIAVVCGLGALLSWLSGLPVWGGCLIVTGALLVNGFLAQVEDRMPGGIEDPNKPDD